MRGFIARTVTGLALASIRMVGDNRVSCFVSELTLQFQANRTRLTAKSFRLQCAPFLLVWSAEVVVGRLAAGLRLRYVTLSGRSLRLLEMNSPARDGSSKSKPRHGW